MRRTLVTMSTRRSGGIRRLASRLGRILNRLVADRTPTQRPPGANYIPNSNGKGGRVISSWNKGSGV